MGNCFGRGLAPVILHPRQYAVDNPDFPYYKCCLGLHTATHVNTATLLLLTFLLFIAIMIQVDHFLWGAAFFGHHLYITTAVFRWYWGVFQGPRSRLPARLGFSPTNINNIPFLRVVLFCAT